MSRGTYEAPACKFYSISIESVVMQTSGGTSNSANDGYDDNNNLGEI
jgi:hypothetical protein